MRQLHRCRLIRLRQPRPGLWRELVQGKGTYMYLRQVQTTNEAVGRAVALGHAYSLPARWVKAFTPHPPPLSPLQTIHPIVPLCPVGHWPAHMSDTSSFTLRRGDVARHEAPTKEGPDRETRPELSPLVPPPLARQALQERAFSAIHGVADPCTGVCADTMGSGTRRQLAGCTSPKDPELCTTMARAGWKVGICAGDARFAVPTSRRSGGEGGEREGDHNQS
ncbi:hypothetical protein M433DRAFT_243579 [Acidomyces richmondensis BFW]|nr:MAG: hypothetical protein FE78DRAFT_389322 [Acidomyces sp. 'richmondensis']KYG45685.1 hypothetical protein M433DRAFT_243579 [Acidomyces richmondensis BFW]